MEGPFVVTVRCSGPMYEPGVEYEEWCDVEAAGKGVGSGSNLYDCSEDANLGRDLGFVYKLHKRLREAWQAGKDGRAFVLNEKEEVD